jgi:hypothetical protein
MQLNVVIKFPSALSICFYIALAALSAFRYRSRQFGEETQNKPTNHFSSKSLDAIANHNRGEISAYTSRKSKYGEADSFRRDASQRHTKNPSNSRIDCCDVPPAFYSLLHADFTAL